ncbi:MAG: DNA-binding response regulator [Chlorobiaceae bacterium]|nr:DNA-binding response regulator [Chlorobiaceae bacterium]
MEQSFFIGKKILLVEDEESLAIGLEFNLSDEGFVVEWAKDGRKALEFIEKNEYDLIILDIMLPYFNGFQIVEKLRLLYPQTPVLMLTARASTQDKIKGLELGADDYLTKPFHLKELLLRVKGMLKRKTWYKKFPDEKIIYKLGSWEINFEKLMCKNESYEFFLTQREAMVLKYFFDNKGKIVSRKELLANVWEINSDVETRTVDNFISRLRKYFEKDPNNPKFIKSVRSAGYIFSDDVSN